MVMHLRMLLLKLNVVMVAYIRTEDVIAQIEELGDELALVWRS
jgi:hypothetical protein